MDTSFEEGLEKGREEGREARALEIAKELLLNRISLDVIIQATGLTREQIEKLISK